MRQDTMKALEAFGFKSTTSRKSIEKTESMLTPDESVLFAAFTNYTVTTATPRRKQQYPGVVLLTNNRVIFYYQDFLTTFSDGIALNEIRSISSTGNGLTASHVELHTLTKTYAIAVSYKRELLQKIVKTFETAKSDYIAKQTSCSPNDASDIFSQLEKLADLNAKSILTDAEFASAKAELLSKL